MVLERDGGGLDREISGGGDGGKWTDLGSAVEGYPIGFINESMRRSVKASENQS